MTLGERGAVTATMPANGGLHARRSNWWPLRVRDGRSVSSLIVMFDQLAAQTSRWIALCASFRLRITKDRLLGFERPIHYRINEIYGIGIWRPNAHLRHQTGA
ncbi:hypothetical protein [Bradyrhizobium sp. Cp5.3]|uniref:hypothetical protein n=1 Tax=Bradyrhizobium sp. Cp5.3 TaxID=443598 RepID=UPI0012EB4028|nr:hypothetical protein [Bradyrhizobium sp. Cp5.3]